jgi:dienelactone hydrolase
MPFTTFTPRRAAASLAFGALVIASTTGMAGATTSTAITNGAPPGGPPITRTGTLADGATWTIEVPADWNGTVLLFSHGLVPPGAPNPATVATDPVTEDYLLQEGYALAGSSFATTGWAVEDALRDQRQLLEVFGQQVGKPRRTVAWGPSMGGLLSTVLAERDPLRIDGALSLCGVLGGGVGLMNTYLDTLFVVKHLLAAGSPIDLVDLGDPFDAIGPIVGALDAAQATPEGRARIALAAAMSDVPGWTNADQPEPSPTDFVAQQAHQYDVLRNVTVFLGTILRADIEARVGGNASSNVGVDYGEQLRRSVDRAEVKALYRAAGLDLGVDLAALAKAPRIAADKAAVTELAQFASPSGHLGKVPVLTLHTQSDPLLSAEHEQAYAAAVAEAGASAQLRQAFTERAGHCTFSPAETVAALHAVIDRVETGGWKGTHPAALNAAATALGPELNVHFDEATGTLVPTPPAFTKHRPGVFLRPLIGPATKGA